MTSSSLLAQQWIFQFLHENRNDVWKFCKILNIRLLGEYYNCNSWINDFLAHKKCIRRSCCLRLIRTNESDSCLYFLAQISYHQSRYCRRMSRIPNNLTTKYKLACPSSVSRHSIVRKRLILRKILQKISFFPRNPPIKYPNTIIVTRRTNVIAARRVED